MHADTPVSLPESDRGLALIRWTALGFDELRRRDLLSHKCQFELVEGLILHREDWSPRHDRVVAELARRLEPAAAGHKASVAVDEELRLDELDSVVSPDIILLRRNRPPRLVVEVSHTAPRLDARKKQLLYAKAGIDEYWHIELDWCVWRTHASPHRTGYGMQASGPSDHATITRLEGFEDLTLDELLAAADARA